MFFTIIFHRYFAAYSAKMGCRVKTFEPLPRAIRFLNATILMNNLDAQVPFSLVDDEWIYSVVTILVS